MPAGSIVPLLSRRFIHVSRTRPAYRLITVSIVSNDLANGAKHGSGGGSTADARNGKNRMPGGSNVANCATRMREGVLLAASASVQRPAAQTPAVRCVVRR